MSELNQLAQRVRRMPINELRSEITKLLGSANSSELRSEALLAFLELCTGRVLQGPDLEAHVPSILCFWSDAFDRARPMQGQANKIEWKIDEDYSEVRHSAGILLDLMGYLPIHQVEGALREGLSLTDQRLKMFAALSLLRQLRPVEPEELEKIAASHEIRVLLWEQLRLQNMEWMMPETWSKPEMLAASELSRWIAHPMELGVHPEEIELMGSFPIMADSGLAEAFLFRFREYPKPWESSEGWMAGIAGPFRDGTLIGFCCSRFESWDSRTPEDHFFELSEHV